MTWRGSTSIRDRIFASLPYLLPLFYAVPFGNSLLIMFPALQIILLPLIPLAGIYSLIPFAGMILFFVLFLAVVRNESITHFVRFNTMQALLISIVLFLCQLILTFLGSVGGLDLIFKVFNNLIFLGTLAAVVYSVVQSLRGRYAEIPTLSEAVYMQVR